MNEQEIRIAYGNLFMGIKAAFPNSKLFNQEEDIEFWYRMLNDIPLNVLEYAISTYCATNKFAPSIAEIREIATCPQTRDWGKAWELVERAIKSFGYYGVIEALEFIRSEDEIAYEVAKRMNFKEICLSEKIGVERGHFKQMYESYTENMVYEAKLPIGNKETREKLDGMIKRLSGNMALNKGD